MTHDSILIGKGARQLRLDARYANRHGLIAGATGTGKTVTLMVLAEGFSRMGVPVFMADAKGDIAGLAAAETFVPNPDIDVRQAITTLGVGEAFIKSAMRSVGSRLGRELTRGLLGGLFGRKR